MRYLFIGFGLAALLGASSVESAEPQYPFVTSPGAILCSNYFAIKDAKAAFAARDKSWFDRTGCIQARAEWRVVLIEAPLVSDAHGNTSPDSNLPWRGRVYPSDDDQADGINAYFDPSAILTYAFATVPNVFSLPSGPSGANLPKLTSVMSGSKPIEFKSIADAEQWYKKNIHDYYKPSIARTAINEDGTTKLLLGPASYGLLDLVCGHGKPSCVLLGQLPR